MDEYELIMIVVNCAAAMIGAALGVLVAFYST